ncbi:MAG: hypothetical protein DRP27_08100 [Thermotogae bacterium]|nr:MAG: hypothetical protein DRP27_08100 [Thermotogota bacterium]
MSSKRRRKASQAVATGATAPSPVTPTPKRELTEEEKAFLGALGDLVSSAQELAYALAAVDAETLGDNPELKEVIEAARSVVRAVWRFHRLVKTRMVST